MVMDHGRFGPNGANGGAPGGLNRVSVVRGDSIYEPPHRSKDQDIQMRAGDSVLISTPGGGGYGNAFARDPHAVATDVARGYYTAEQAEERFGVVLTGEPPEVDEAATILRRKAAGA